MLLAVVAFGEPEWKVTYLICEERAWMSKSESLVSHDDQRGLKPLRRSQCIREDALEGDADVGLLVVVDAHADCGFGPSYPGGHFMGSFPRRVGR